jgi:hypothetical protein
MDTFVSSLHLSCLVVLAIQTPYGFKVIIKKWPGLNFRFNIRFETKTDRCKGKWTRLIGGLCTISVR